MFVERVGIIATLKKTPPNGSFFAVIWHDTCQCGVTPRDNTEQVSPRPEKLESDPLNTRELTMFLLIVLLRAVPPPFEQNPRYCRCTSSERPEMPQRVFCLRERGTMQLCLPHLPCNSSRRWCPSFRHYCPRHHPTPSPMPSVTVSCCRAAESPLGGEGKVCWPCQRPPERNAGTTAEPPPPAPAPPRPSQDRQHPPPRRVSAVVFDQAVGLPGSMTVASA